MLKKIIFQISFHVMMGIMLSSSLAGAASGDIKKILLSEEGNWPPYTYELQGTATQGLSLDLMNELFRRLRVPFELKLYPMQRCINQMKNGSRDAMTLISKNSEREKILEFTLPIMKSVGFIYYDTNREKPIQWNHFSDLKPYQIGIVMGYNYGEAFKNAKAKEKLSVQEVVRIEQNFSKLLAGRIDLMLANQAEIIEFLRNNSKYHDRIKAAEKPYISYVYHMGFSKRSEARQIIPMINKEIKNMKSDGTMNQILGKYIYTIE